MRRCLSQFFSFAAIAAVFNLILGCGASAPSTPAAKAPPSSASAASRSATSENTAEPNSSAGEAKDTGSETAVAPAAKSSAGAPAKEQDGGEKKTDKPAPVPVKQVIKPTEAQLAKWQRTPFEPLQLLECRTTKSLGLISHLAALGDGKHIVLAGKSVVIASTDAKEAEITLYEAKGEQEIKSLAVSPDGKWIAVGDSEGMLRIWDAVDHKEVASKKVDTNDVVEIAISPDSQELATISYDSDVSIWSAPKIEEKKKFKVKTNGLKQIEYLANGELVAAGETMTTWNTSSGEEIKSLTKGRYNTTLARMPDGSRLAFTDEDKLHFWNVADSKKEASLLGGFASSELLTFAPEGKWVVSANGNSIRIWDLASRQLMQTIDAIGWPVVGITWLPQSNLLVVASVNGRVRVWGAEKAGEAVGLKPLHGPVAPLAVDARIPATPAQMLDAIDLRSFPLLPDCAPRLSSETMVDYEAPVAVEEAQTFYRHFLDKAGWKESEKASAVPDSLEFTKGGMRLLATFRPESGKTAISLNASGNYDLRWAPQFAGGPIEPSYESEQTVMYNTKADLLSVEIELLRKMHEAGWTAYSRLNTSHHEREDQRDLDFLQNGVNLSISIGKFPAKPDSYAIQSSALMVPNSVPIPADCGFVEFDGSTAPKLVANTSLSLAEATDFYDKKLAEQGWLAREDGRSLKEDQCWLAYIRGQRDLTVGLTKLENGRTLVQVGDGFANSSWQLAKPKPADETKAGEGIEAADFPVLNETKTAKFDPTGKAIEIDMGKIALPEAGDQYAKAMTGLGWKQDGAGIKDNEYVFLTFKKEKAEVALRARLMDGKAIVNIQGDGLLWTKELPTGKKVVSYETWLRTNSHPAGLGLLDAYQKEMQGILNGGKSATKE